ncbi:MAG: dockerin type I repeat-containing protein [Oscillospiraceae bacterium]|nr:dockerin type I repeat-containing protein [Oscillospiraceae bacterium]
MKKQRITAFLTAWLMCFTLFSGQKIQTQAAESIAGDVNADNVFNMADIILFQKWLHAVPDTHLANWKAADFNQDEVLNIFDFCMMKRELLSQNVKPVTTGKLYQRTGVIDPYISVNVFQTLLPEGWTAASVSDWNNYSLAYPGVELVELTSPDGTAKIQIQSPRNYLQDLLWGKAGKNLEEYATFSTYMNADTYVQSSVQSVYETALLVKDFGQNEEQLVYQEEQTAYYANHDYQQQTEWGYTFQLEGTESTNARQQYQCGNVCMEVSSEVNAYQYAKSYIINVAGERRIVWWIPYTVVYIAESQEAFDAYYDDYEVIVGNSYFTKEFFTACEKAGKYIEYLMLSGKTVSIDEWLGTYTYDGIYSASAQSAQDNIFQAWDDYIKDENSYTLNDGSTLRVPTAVDVVAQSGDSLYFGTSAGIPSGYDTLTIQ